MIDVDKKMRNYGGSRYDAVGFHDGRVGLYL